MFTSLLVQRQWTDMPSRIWVFSTKTGVGQWEYAGMSATRIAVQELRPESSGVQNQELRPESNGVQNQELRSDSGITSRIRNVLTRTSRNHY